MLKEEAKSISIIIPTLNEADQLPKLLLHLKLLERKELVVEVIVCDGNSDDCTVQIAQSFNVQVLSCNERKRASQMNRGAQVASGEILYFLHADSIPHVNTVGLILQQVNKGYQSGCFRLKFDLLHWFLRANSWFTRFAVTAIRFGDQSLFITRSLFRDIGGFDENLFIMEDQEIIVRAKKSANFIVIPEYIITSARKYKTNGAFRLQFIFYWLFLLYKLGWSQPALKRVYKKLIH